MQRSWISQYDSGVPATIEYADWTVPDLLRRSAARFPDSSALLFYGKTMSFRRSGVASIHWRNSRHAQRASCLRIETSWPMHFSEPDHGDGKFDHPAPALPCR